MSIYIKFFWIKDSTLFHRISGQADNFSQTSTIQLQQMLLIEYMQFSRDLIDLTCTIYELLSADSR